jgi:hypothetical protein
VMNSQFSGCGSTTWTVPTGPEDVAAAMMPPSVSYCLRVAYALVDGKDAVTSVDNQPVGAVPSGRPSSRTRFNDVAA